MVIEEKESTMTLTGSGGYIGGGTFGTSRGDGDSMGNASSFSSGNADSGYSSGDEDGGGFGFGLIHRGNPDGTGK